MENKREFTGVWIPKHIIEDTSLKSTERIVYQEIASFDICYMDNAMLASKVGVSESTISRTIQKLKKKKYITEVFFDGRKRQLKAKYDEPVSAKRLGRVGKMPRQSRHNAETHYIREQEENKEEEVTVVEAPKKPTIEIPQTLLEIPEFMATWEKWLQYRKERKIPNTPISLKEQLILLEAHSTIAVDMMTKSIRNSWRGLFAPEDSLFNKPKSDGKKEAWQLTASEKEDIANYIDATAPTFNQIPNRQRRKKDENGKLVRDANGGLFWEDNPNYDADVERHKQILLDTETKIKEIYNLKDSVNVWALKHKR